MGSGGEGPNPLDTDNLMNSSEIPHSGRKMFSLYRRVRNWEEESDSSLADSESESVRDEDEHWPWDDRSIGSSPPESESDEGEGINDVSGMQEDSVRHREEEQEECMQSPRSQSPVDRPRTPLFVYRDSGESEIEDEEEVEDLQGPLIPMDQIPFFKSLTARSLNSNLNGIKNALQKYEVGDKDLDIVNVFYSNDRLVKTLKARPFDPSTALLIRQHWCNAQVLDRYEACQYLDVRITRSKVMMSNHVVWEWLVNDCICAVKSIVMDKQAHTQDVQWIYKLALDMEAAFKSRTSRKTFQASAYIPGLKDANNYVYKHSRQRSKLEGIEKAGHIADLVLVAVSLWLDFPHGGFELQAYFIGHILTSIGPSCLFLDGVWDAWSNIQPQVLCKPKSAHIVDNLEREFASFDHHLSNHPITQKGSQEHRCAQSIWDCFTVYLDSRRQTKGSRKALISNLQPSSSSISPGGSKRFPSAKPEMMLRYLLVLLPLLEADYHPPQSNISPEDKVRVKVLKNMDGLLPFREHGPSRKRIMMEDGPFSPANIQTKAGFFSALIFRGITFTCAIIQDNHVLFKDASDWNQVVKDIKARNLGDRYISNPNAYTSYTFREPSLGDKYWITANDPKFNSWLFSRQPDTKSDYVVMWKMFKEARDGDGEMAFPSFGNLVAHLLAADYTYADGPISKPTCDEMGSIISTIKSGATKGLILLGYGDKLDETTTKEAFKELYEYLEEKLTAPQKERMTFDTLMLEHALCKIQKVHKGDWWSTSPGTYIQ